MIASPPVGITTEILYPDRDGKPMSDNTRQFYDPEDEDFTYWIRNNGRLEFVEFETSFVSPRLGIRFEIEEGGTLEIYRPDGQPFMDFAEIDRLRQEAIDRADQAEAQIQKLAAKLRELGIEPDEL
jgi:hypothetical protein